jgi:hypothetical protein
VFLLIGEWNGDNHAETGLRRAKAVLVTNVSALIALACFAIACYVMARRFDVPVVPSAITDELCIVLLAPSILVLGLSIVFA